MLTLLILYSGSLLVFNKISLTLIFLGINYFFKLGILSKVLEKSTKVTKPSSFRQFSSNLSGDFMVQLYRLIALSLLNYSIKIRDLSIISVFSFTKIFSITSIILAISSGDKHPSSSTSVKSKTTVYKLLLSFSSSVILENNVRAIIISCNSISWSRISFYPLYEYFLDPNLRKRAFGMASPISLKCSLIILKKSSRCILPLRELDPSLKVRQRSLILSGLETE